MKNFETYEETTDRLITIITDEFSELYDKDEIKSVIRIADEEGYWSAHLNTYDRKVLDREVELKQLHKLSETIPEFEERIKTQKVCLNCMCWYVVGKERTCSLCNATL